MNPRCSLLSKWTTGGTRFSRKVKARNGSDYMSFQEGTDVLLAIKSKFKKNKKVLLRERKRHTARRVVSTPSVVLPGYPPPPS